MRSLLAGITCLCLFATALHAQIPHSDDIAAALDDGGLSKPHNLVKFDAFAPLAGEIALGYERVVRNWFTFDISAGLGLPFYLIDLRNATGTLGMSDPTQDLTRHTGGYSFSVSPRIYIQGSAPEFYHLGPGYRFRRINRSQNYDLVLQDYYLAFGNNYYIGQRILLSYSFGVGLRQTSYKSHAGFMDLSVLNKVTLSLPLSLHLGYIF